MSHVGRQCGRVVPVLTRANVARISIVGHVQIEAFVAEIFARNNDRGTVFVNQRVSEN